MKTKKLKANKKKGFTLFEMIISVTLLTLLMSPFPKMVATIINYQIKEESKNLLDINEMFTEMERDFLYLNGHKKDIDNNGFDGKENFHYDLERTPFHYSGVLNKTMDIKTFYGCEITYGYNSNTKIFSKTINVNPVNVNCGRELKVDNIKTLEFNKINNIIVFDLKITKDWDKSNNFTQFIKIRPFM